MEVYVVCFDISDDRIRNKIGKALLQYGDRVQESVFEISVKQNGELVAIRETLLDLTNNDDNNIRFYRICGSCREASSTLQGDRVAHFPAVLII